METTPEDLSTLYEDGHVQSVITSYGAGHHDDPGGNAVVVDTRPLRNPPEDPEVRDRMLHSNGLDPEVVVIGGEITKAWGLVEPLISAAVTRNLRARAIAIRPSTFEVRPSLKGAFTLVLNELLSVPHVG